MTHRSSSVRRSCLPPISVRESVAVLVLPILGEYHRGSDHATMLAMKKILAATLLLMVFATPAAFAMRHHHHRHHHHRPA